MTPLARCAWLLACAGCGGAATQHSAAGSMPPPAPAVESGALDAHALLAASAELASAAGAGPLSIVASGEAAERERLGAFVEVPAAMCLLGSGRASSSVEDLDLAAFSDDGTPVAVDDGPDSHPTLLLCPPHPERVYLGAVAAAGEGLVAVGAQLVPPAQAAAVGKAMNAHGTRTASSRAAEAWPGLDDHVRRHHEALGGVGAWDVLRKVAIAVDARIPASVAFPLEPDACTDALIVPDDDVGGLEVEAQDERGRLLARASTGERDRTLTVCSSVLSSGSLTVRPHVGQGLAAVVLSRSRGEVARGLAAAPDVAWVAATLPLDQARARREAELHGAGYGGARGREAGAASVGASRSVGVELGAPDGGARDCWRFDVVGGAPAALLSASAWDDAGRLLATAEGASTTTLFACRTHTLRIDVEAHGRPGPYALLWRPEPWIDPAFAAHPTAAGRMLTRMANGATGLLDGAPSFVRTSHVEAAHALSWTEVIPAGTCARIVAAGEGAGGGLIGRLFDVAGGDELDRGHGADSVVLRACAAGGALRSISASIDVAAGAMDVVIGERLIP